MKCISWFTGIGGFDLALGWAGHTVVAHSEIDPYCCAVLKKHWPGVLNLGDIKRVRPELIPEADIWTGGFPCQPFSVAGKQRADADERNLWPALRDLVSDCRPRWLVLENVPGLLAESHGYFWNILSDLAACGYDAEWVCLSAAEVGAPHRRDRLWVVAYLADTDEARRGLERVGGLLDRERSVRGRDIDRRNGAWVWPHGWAIDPADVANPGHGEPQERQGDDTERGQRSTERRRAEQSTRSRAAGRDGIPGDEHGVHGPADEHPNNRCPCCGADQGLAHPDSESTQRSTEPREKCAARATPPVLGRVANGIPHRVHRLRALGNSVVPQVAYEIIKRISRQG